MRNSNTSRNGLVCACMAGALFANAAWALDPSRRTSQYVRDQWGPERGLASGPIYALAQTSDGYLWIGGETGLARFDGITFDAFDPGTHVLGLAADRANGLWIRARGLRLLYRGPSKFNDVLSSLQPPAAGVTAMIPNVRGGAPELLFATPWTGIKFLRGAKLEQVQTREPLPRASVISIATASNGEIWLGTNGHGLVRLQGDGVSIITKGLPDLAIQSLLPGANGELIIGTGRGIVRWNGREIVPGSAFPDLGDVVARAMIRDRDGNIWVAAGVRGLIRIDPQSAVTIAFHNGEAVNTVLEDREGNIWAGADNGLVRIRDSVFAAFSAQEGLPSTAGSVFVDRQDRTWFGPAEGGLYCLRNGQAERIPVPGLDRDIVYSIAQGASGIGSDYDLWLGRQQGGLTHLWKKGAAMSSTSYKSQDGLAQDHVFAVTVGRDGAVWAGTLSGGLSRFLNGKFTRYRTTDGLASDTINSIVEGTDAMWFATPAGVSSFSRGVWRTWTTQDGLPSANVNCLLEDSGGTLWAGTSDGLAWKDSSGFHAPAGVSESPREPILGMAEDPDGWIWVTTESRVVRIRREGLQAASQTRGLRRGEDFREYQTADGLPGLAGVKRDRSVVADGRGRVWLSMARGLAVVDTGRLSGRSIPPLVRVAGVLADGKPVAVTDPLHIPAGTRQVTLEYAGVTLSRPELTRFRYMLENADRGWNEQAAAQQVIYSNLEPGAYRFRVMASNADGNFNSSEAVAAFVVEPLLWQRWSVRTAFVIALGLTLLFLVRLRMQRVARQMNLRFEERLSERARIAGELHDTLLQTVQASRMIAESARLDHSADPARLRDAIDGLCRWLEQASNEGRAALQALRSPAEQKNDLADAIRRMAEISEVASSMAFVLTAEGTQRELHPLVRDEVYRIVCEAIRNALRHSGASEMQVLLRYSRNFTVTIKDNGRGIPEEIVAAGRPGHFGLQGMQERACRIHGTLRLRTRANVGTEVDLIVPGSAIFVRPGAGRGSVYSRLRGLLQRKGSKF